MISDITIYRELVGSAIYDSLKCLYTSQCSRNGASSWVKERNVFESEHPVVISESPVSPLAIPEPPVSPLASECEGGSYE